jgi:predicted nucleic acid-binding protein
MGRAPFVELITPFIQEHQAATSILVYAEVIEYLKGLPDFPRRRQQLQILLREIYPYFLTYAIVERYADIRRSLRGPHGPGLIGDVDTLIAATALERNLTVITLDQDFTRVPGLRVQLLERPRSTR